VIRTKLSVVTGRLVIVHPNRSSSFVIVRPE